MFTHPSLLRSLFHVSDFLRRSGESAWARDLKTLSEKIHRQGWTQDSLSALQVIFEGESSLYSLSFGAEHERWLHGEKGMLAANEKLQELCLEIKEHMLIPTVASAGAGLRPRSPDLE